jgi:cyclic pyranopterin phosphate synthase
MPAGGVRRVKRDALLAFEEIVSFVRILKSRFGLSKIRLTGGEPLVRPGIIDLVAMLADEGVPDLALTTNAQFLAPLAPDLKRAGLGRVNISLDTLDPLVYWWLTRGRDLRLVLEGIHAAKAAGLQPVKLNAIVLRGVNDSDRELAGLVRYAARAGCEVRFLELMPIGPAAAKHEEWFVSSAEVRRRLSHTFDLRPSSGCTTGGRPGGTSRDYLARDEGGWESMVGFISSCTSPFCGGCNRLRLTATGRLVGCLARSEGLDLRPLLRGEGPGVERQLAEAVEGALDLKRRTRRFARQEMMVKVGG